MPPTLTDLARYFVRLGATGFGGPAALTDRMRVDLVERRHWLTTPEFDLGLALAAACPGPLAYQLAVYCGHVRHGLAGAAVVAIGFVLAPFVLVVGLGAVYGHLSGPVARGLFSGAAPVVVVLIARACWSLGWRTLGHRRVAWLLAGSGFVVTWGSGREPTWLFVAGALVGAMLLRPGGRRPRPAAAGSAPSAQGPHRPAALFALVGASPVAGVHASLFAFFFKTGCLVFGSGLVIVPFLREAVVVTHGWITPDQFLDSVTIGLVSPGPVVITAAFVGFLVGGVTGALAATVGMFLPAVIFTVLAAPWFARHHHRPTLIGAVGGITAVVVGVLAGTVPLIAATAVPDALAVVILGATLVGAGRRLLPDPWLVLSGGAVGMLAAI